MLGTNVSRRVISPDCDSHGDRVTVVVRARRAARGPAASRCGRRREGSCARCACASARVRSRSAGRRTRASAARPRRTAATAARDRPRRARQHARASALAIVCARGRVLAPDRAIIAGKRLRVGISADARGLRLDLARLGGGGDAVLARGDARARRRRAPPAAPGGRRLRRQQPPRRAHGAGPAGSARRAEARVALVVVTRPDGGRRCLPAAAGRARDPLRRPHAARGRARARLRGYTAIVAPRSTRAEGSS